MDTIMDLCFLCTKDYDCEPIHEKIVSQVEYLLPEITIIKLCVPLRICSVCDGALCAFSKFKQSCVESSRRLEASIKGAQGLPLHTGSPTVVDDNETSSVKSEYIEEIFIKKGYVEETPMDRQIHTDRASLNPITLVETVSAEPQNQNMQLRTYTNTDNTEEISIKEEQIEETAQDRLYYNKILKEECVSNSPNDDTDKPEKIEETSVKEEYVEETPLDTQMHTDRASLNPIVLLERISVEPQNKNMQLHKNTNTDNIEEITIKEEPIEETPQDRLYYNKILKEECVSNSTIDDTDSQPEHKTEDESATFNTSEEVWEGSSADFKEETVEESDGNYSKHILTCTNKITNKTKDHRCNVCSKLFVSKNFLTRHMKENHWRLRNLPCTVCKKMFIHKYDLNKHMDLHNGIKKFPCLICKKSFFNDSNLKQHLKLHFQRKENKTQAKHQIKDSLACPVCNKKLKYKYLVKRHLKTHTEVNDFQCGVCNKSFTRKDNLNCHMKLHSGEKDFQCGVCNKSFTQKSHLKLHMKIHSGAKDFQCGVCNKSFTQKGNLNLHMKIHSGMKDFQCGVCNKSFTRNNNLNRHMKIHSGVKDFQCGVCNKSFTQKGNLNLHMKIHSGVKDFQCGVCNKSFALKYYLNCHMKIHSGVKDFQCGVCNKSFTQKGNLNLHMKIHSGVKDSQCGVCNKSFTQKGALNKHMKNHSRIHC